ncbi:hypothetical protein F4782DRAFT_134187 [Xylaria castorea]|nr:hypothetical protein F4782DRAFT_134187 [Xylaria castorea]
MEYYIDPQLMDGLSSTDGEADLQPAVANAVTEAQESFLDYPFQDEGFVFQSHVPSYYPPYTDFASPYASPYPEAPLMESGMDYDFFNPYTPIEEQVAPEFTQPMYPHAPEPWSITYSNFAPPPFPASYPPGPGPVQTSPPGPLPSTSGTNKYLTRLRARKALHPNSPSQSKNKGIKHQPVRRPISKKVSKPLQPDEALKLSKPLSQLALESPGIPVSDITAYIHRGANKRMQQRSRDGSRVSRPSNAFVLYRKAYSDHIKAMMSTTQNYIVSRVAGASWKMEDKEVKDKFSEYACEEKRQHFACFPDYKYKPGARKHRDSEAATEAATESENELVLEEIWADMQESCIFAVPI